MLAYAVIFGKYKILDHTFFYRACSNNFLKYQSMSFKILILRIFHLRKIIAFILLIK